MKTTTKKEIKMPNISLEEMMKDIQEMHQAVNLSKNRSMDTIIPRLLAQIAQDKGISGEHEFTRGFMNIVTEYGKNTEFKAAIDGVAKVVFTMFPPDPAKAKSKLDLNDDENMAN